MREERSSVGEEWTMEQERRAESKRGAESLSEGKAKAWRCEEMEGEERAKGRGG